MTVSKKEEYDTQFTLTRSEMAESLGISTNALKCRMRKGNTEGLDFRHDGNKFLFKRLRGNQHGQTPLNIRPKGRWHDGNKKKKKDWSEVRRGVTHIGEAKYPNEAFRKHNELKILNRITKEVPQYVLDKINPRLLSLAQRQHDDDLEKAQGTFSEPKYYGGMNHRNNRRYTTNFNSGNTEVNTGFNPLKNYDYYSVNSSEHKEDTRPIEYTWSEPRVREPGADYKPGKFKHLDDAISKAKKR
jgi:hypothetical protein